jgi:hypothetical protein
MLVGSIGERLHTYHRASSSYGTITYLCTNVFTCSALSELRNATKISKLQFVLKDN